MAGFEAGDGELVAWAIGAVASSLMQEGLSSPELLSIAREALRDYRRVRDEERDPRAYLVDAILRRARAHIQLRGIEPGSPQPQREPWHFLDLIATKEAMATLTDDDRRLMHLIYFKKKSLENIAEMLDVSVAYVEIRARKAVEKLWAWLRSRGAGA